MGNKNSCCVTGSPSGSSTGLGNGSGKKYQQRNNNHFHHEYENPSTWIREETSGNLQHISEREPDDIDQDPSTHPTKGPIFMERSKSEIKIRDHRVSLYFINSHSAANQENGSQILGPNSSNLVKSSSCSTIFLDDSTISQPNLKNTIKCISLAIYYHISNRKNRGQERLMEIFDERKHPITSDPIPADFETRDPEHKHIYRFIRTLFSAAQLTAECAIITLVYIERLLTYAEIDLCPSNWRRVVLGAIMLASKVWDDQAVWNVDYCQILRRCTVEDMNELERQFLESLEFNINVPSSVYAKYYFDLRTLAMANDLQLPLQPLYKERAKKLELFCCMLRDKQSCSDKAKRGLISLVYCAIMSHGHSHCCQEHEHDHGDERGVLYSLYLKINLDEVTCLNESIDGSGKTIFKPWEERLDKERYVQSDVDAELLFNVPFVGNVKIKNIIIVGGENDSHPKSMRLFSNRPSMTFDSVSITPDKEFELTRDEQGVVEYPLPMTKFSNVNHLTIHFPSSFGGETTKIFYIGFSGEFLGVPKEGIVIATYEARPMPQDHKGEIKDAANFQVL